MIRLPFLPSPVTPISADRGDLVAGATEVRRIVTFGTTGKTTCPKIVKARKVAPRVPGRVPTATLDDLTGRSGGRRAASVCHLDGGAVVRRRGASSRCHA